MPDTHQVYSQALCHSCNGVAETRLVTRDVPLDDGSDVVRDLSVFACMDCDETVAVPAWAVAKITGIETPRAPERKTEKRGGSGSLTIGGLSLKLAGVSKE